jgi:hypothetical protein
MRVRREDCAIIGNKKMVGRKKMLGGREEEWMNCMLCGIRIVGVRPKLDVNTRSTYLLYTSSTYL